MEIKDGLSITVKAKFEVDEATVRTCINLLNIYGRSRDLAGMVIMFGEYGPEVAESKDREQMLDMISAV